MLFGAPAAVNVLDVNVRPPSREVNAVFAIQNHTVEASEYTDGVAVDAGITAAPVTSTQPVTPSAER
ncbi:hypothetical protein D3C75_697360 [compost metagenome]